MWVKTQSVLHYVAIKTYLLWQISNMIRSFQGDGVDILLLREVTLNCQLANYICDQQPTTSLTSSLCGTSPHTYNLHLYIHTH